MYILRHPSGGLPPLSVSRAPGGPAYQGKIDILSTPRTQGSILRDGTDCIVMQVLDAPVELLVTAYLAQEGATVPSIKIDQIGLELEPAQPADVAPAAAGKQIEISPQGLSLIGHIERTGDVVASEGQCLGDPSSNLRLEGFQVMWPDRPEGVDLAYGVALEGLGSTPLASIGKFCGTKNEARRIIEVTFTLVGSQAALLQLEGTAHFSGGFQIPVSSGMPLSGPSGLEHLTALCLRTLPAPPAKKKEPNLWNASQQTQVFKAKTSATKTSVAPKTVAKKPLAKAAKAK